MITRRYEVSAAPVVEIDHEFEPNQMIVQVFQNNFVVGPSIQIQEDKIKVYGLEADATVVVVGEAKRAARKSSNGSKRGKSGGSSSGTSA